MEARQRVAHRMREAGGVVNRIDAIGNVIGVLPGSSPPPPAIVTADSGLTHAHARDGVAAPAGSARAMSHHDVRICSSAGHDTIQMAHLAPTGMIFAVADGTVLPGNCAPSHGGIC